MQTATSTHNQERSSLISQIAAHFTTETTNIATSKAFYSIDKVIGKGAFGKVYLGTHVLTGLPVALKQIQKSYLNKSEHA
jgi:serine/threonine protein kinase